MAKCLVGAIKFEIKYKNLTHATHFQQKQIQIIKEEKSSFFVQKIYAIGG